jgi:hypothetical protein
MKKTSYTILAILVLTQLFGWWLFSPIEGADPYYDLARIFYYVLIFPLGAISFVVGVVFLIAKPVFMDKKLKLFIYIFTIISFITYIPPLFKIARYVFYPLNLLIGG